MNEERTESAQKILDTLKSILDRIDDPEMLNEIISLSKDRLTALGQTFNQNGIPHYKANNLSPLHEPFEPRPEIQLEIKNEVWYAVRQTDDRRIRLCDRLSTYQLNLQTQKRPPSRRSYLLEEDDALELSQNDPEAVSFWQVSKEGEVRKQYYRVRDFRQKYRDWQKYMRLAQDEMTQDLGLTVEARAVIQKLEDQGYLVLPPDWIF